MAGKSLADLSLGTAGASLINDMSNTSGPYAGAIRKIASDELNGRADEHLAELARPFVDPASVWSTKRQWW